jgi:hypothetical protein
MKEPFNLQEFQRQLVEQEAKRMKHRPHLQPLTDSQRLKIQKQVEKDVNWHMHGGNEVNASTRFEFGTITAVRVTFGSHVCILC